MAVLAADAVDAVEETLPGPLDPIGEVLEHIAVCSTYKSEDLCPRQAGCLWTSGPVAGDVNCEAYVRIVGEYVSCIETDPTNYASYTSEAQVQAAFAA